MCIKINRFKPGHILIPAGALLSLMPFMSPGIALLLGILMAVVFENPYIEQTRKYTHRLLALSVVGLGAGMNLEVVARAGLHGIGYTVIGIILTLLIGLLIGKLFKIKRDASVLITIGTAICGGSAIAAVAPTIHAKQHDISVALGTVFTLNAMALFIFPWIGHHLNLTQVQFGLWSALAIHDTSSVVGATLHYGAQALEVGTTVKLARALWIVPLTLVIGYIYAKRNLIAVEDKKLKFPWFILGFLAMAALVTFIPLLQPAGLVIQTIAKHALVLTLFLIGVNLSRATLRAVGIQPFIQGVLLWVIVASTTLGAVIMGFIN